MVDLRDAIRWEILKSPDPLPGQPLVVRITGEHVIMPALATFTLVTDANVASRVATLLVDDGTTTYFRATANTAQAASLTRHYSISKGIGGGTPGTIIPIPIPSGEVPFEPGHNFRIVVENMQPGDQISGFAAKLVAFPSGPGYVPIPYVSLLVEPRNGFDSAIPPIYSP